MQNGIPGLLDTFGDGGFISCAIATNAQKVACGGLIDSDSFSRESYVETDGTQYIDLGYYAQSDTRFELDCAVVKPDSTNDLYIFGTHGGYKAGNFPFSMFVIKNSKGLGWNCEANKSSYLALTSTRITAERQKFVLDAYGNKVSVLAADGTTLHTGTIGTDHANAKSPYEIAIGSSRGKNGVPTDPIKLKIYTAASTRAEPSSTNSSRMSRTASQASGTPLTRFSRPRPTAGRTRLPSPAWASMAPRSG